MSHGSQRGASDVAEHVEFHIHESYTVTYSTLPAPNGHCNFDEFQIEKVYCVKKKQPSNNVAISDLILIV
jgi:hypothetical protein